MIEFNNWLLIKREKYEELLVKCKYYRNMDRVSKMLIEDMKQEAKLSHLKNQEVIPQDDGPYEKYRDLLFLSSGFVMGALFLLICFTFLSNPVGS